MNFKSERENADIITKPLNTDVLIIGAGAAGLTAALTAHFYGVQ